MLPARFVRSFHEAHREEMVAAGLAPEWEVVKVALRRLRVGRICVTAGELDAGMTGIATPLRDLDGAVDASLGFVLPDTERTEKRLEDIGKSPRQAAERLEAERIGTSPASTPAVH
ncbi:MAG: hypothetical protein H7Y08_10910 [Rhizobiaceae bacterium]|nr:hypothetical protein [Rhizobiaceae bacterium]